jgi:hypothetical protein
MFRESSRVLLLAIALAALMCHGEMLAQRGAGGGHTGGGVATGGGLANVGRSTGLDEKDDLRDYHEALADQASSEQIAAYSVMLKMTDAASAELQGFQEQLTMPTNAESESRSTAIEKKIEQARTESKKFLDGLSDAQKSGLKEVVRKLIKDDSDLAQAARSFVLEAGNAKGAAQPVVVSAQNVERALATFRSHLIDLGQEMSIGSGLGQDSNFNLATLKSSLTFANQPITITTSGVVSQGNVEGGQEKFALELNEDLSDLQQNATEVLRAQLNKYDRCGERIEINGANLAARAPAILLTVQLHYERWSCQHGDFNELSEGNGTVEVKVIPSIANDGTVRLTAEMGRVDVPGMVGESLRTGLLGDSLRDKVTEALLSTINRGADFKTLLPASAQGSTTLLRARFEGTGLGRLNMLLNGEIRVPNEKAAVLAGELKQVSPQLPASHTAQSVSR